MIEKKHRAWDEENEMMLYEDYLCTKEMSLYEQKRKIGDFWKMALWHEWIIMDFTGLKDKNGNEIYGGDILKIIAISAKSPRMKWEKREYIGEVKYTPPAFNIYPDNKILLVDGLYRKELEVIGNIYENKDLLNEPH